MLMIYHGEPQVLATNFAHQNIFRCRVKIKGLESGEEKFKNSVKLLKPSGLDVLSYKSELAEKFS